MNNLVKLHIEGAEGAPLRKTGRVSYPYVKFTWENIAFKTPSKRGPDVNWNSTFILNYNTSYSSPKLILYIYDGQKGNNATIGYLNLNFSKLKVVPLLQGTFHVQGVEGMTISLFITGSITPPVPFETVSRVVQPVVPYTPPKVIKALPPVVEEKVEYEAIENEVEVQQETTVESAVEAIESDMSTPVVAGDLQEDEELPIEEVLNEPVYPPEAEICVQQQEQDIEVVEEEEVVQEEETQEEEIQEEEAQHELEIKQEVGEEEQETEAPLAHTDVVPHHQFVGDIEMSPQEAAVEHLLENEPDEEVVADEEDKHVDIHNDDIDALIEHALPTEEEKANTAVYESIDMEFVKNLKSAFPSLSFQLIIKTVKEGGSEDEITQKVEKYALQEKEAGIDFAASAKQRAEAIEEQTDADVPLSCCKYSDLFDKEVNIPELKYGVNLITSFEEDTDIIPSGRKKALFVAINYIKTSKPLNNCISAAKSLKKFIIDNYGFDDTEESIVFLKDDEEDHKYHPTFQNIVKGMTWLTQGAQPGDILFFHFCGESAYQASEIDGKEAVVETIIPLDYETVGVITNEELQSCLVEQLPSGVSLTAVIDGYNAATGLDLPYIFDSSMFIFDMVATPRSTYGDVICFSGCRENVFIEQLDDMDCGGEFTKAFLSVLEPNPIGLNLEAIQHELVKKLKDNNIIQIPLLTSNQKVPPYRAFNFNNIHPNGNRLIGRVDPKIVYKEDVLKQLKMTYFDKAPNWVIQKDIEENSLAEEKKQEEISN